MMSPIQVVSLVLLVVAFAVAIYRHVNVGLVVLPAGFILTLIAGVSVEKFYTLFPSKLVILILGVSFLFGHAQRSGAVDRITDLAVRGTGGRAWLLPWIMFVIAALLSGIGALPAASLVPRQGTLRW